MNKRADQQRGAFELPDPQGDPAVALRRWALEYLGPPNDALGVSVDTTIANADKIIAWLTAEEAE